MSAAPRLPLSPDAFLDWEAQQNEKHEYHRGEIFQMAGGTEPHARIISNVHFALRLALRDRPCVVYTEAMRVRVDAADLFTYPDLSVVCGEARFYDTRRTALLNPAVLIEVVSPSTERYDRTTKWGMYSQIPELQAYVLVSQDDRAIDVYLRGAGDWRVARTTAGEAALDVLDVRLALDAVYDGVEFPDAGAYHRPR